MLDSIKDFETIAGLEEVLRCIELVEFVNEEKLTDYLEKYDNKFLWQKTGFLCKTFNLLELSDNFYALCKSKISKSSRYLTSYKKEEKYIFNKEWNLCVPENISYILTEGSE